MKLLTGLLLIFQMNLYAQEMQSLSFDEFNSKNISGSKGIVVVNFWATWCKPCVEELPHFEKCNNEFKKNEVKIILANLDFNKQVNTTVKSFLQKKKINSSVIHIRDTDANSWIDKVDSSWSGAIPATSIYQNGNKIFFREGSLSYDELSGLIRKFSKPN